MSDKWHEKHLEMVDVVNNSTTDDEHKAAAQRLYGFRYAACHCVGIRLFGELLEHASEVQRQRGVHRDMWGGVWLDWEPAPTGIDNPTDATERGCVMSEQRPELSLFVWTEFCPDYSNGLAFAIAETVEQAEEMIEQNCGYEVSDWGPVQQFPTTGPIAFYVNGGA